MLGSKNMIDSLTKQHRNESPYSPCKLEQSAVFSLRLKWTSLSANLISKSERRRPASLPYETIRWRAPIRCILPSRSFFPQRRSLWHPEKDHQPSPTRIHLSRFSLTKFHSGSLTRAHLQSRSFATIILSLRPECCFSSYS